MALVKLDGIAHIIVEGETDKKLCDKLSKFCLELKEQALGIMFVNGNSVIPVVYVADTNSTVYEGSCGSGATAVTIYKHKKGLGNKFTLSFPKGELKTEVLDDSSILIDGQVSIVG
jgi:diaminopimelate epimerase